MSTTRTNSASVDWQQNLGAPIGSGDIVSTEVVHTTRLTYTITITNNGDGMATNVTLLDFLPSGMSIEAGGNPQDGVKLNGTIEWELEDIAPFGETIVTLILITD